MSLIAQPESYSDILKRIFAASVVVGTACTLAVAAASPDIRALLDAWGGEAKIGPVEGLKALYVLIPLAIATVSRMFLLHNQISNLFRLRHRFDLNEILVPLAKGVGFSTEGDLWKCVEDQRKKAAIRTFYRYATFEVDKAQIDIQLVKGAADRWAWFWCFVEPQAILLSTAAIFALLRAWPYFWLTLAAVAIFFLVAMAMWPVLQKRARDQVEEILTSQQRRSEILQSFTEFSRISDTQSPAK